MPLAIKVNPSNMSHSARVIALITVVILTSACGNISQTALNAMLIDVAAEFGITTALAQWATTIYMLVLGMAVPIVPFLMRRFSLKHVVLGAILLLFAGSLLASCAWDFPSLIVARVLQAVSAGITMPMMMSVVMMEFPPNKRGTVMGIAGIAMGFSPNIGPTIGGIMSDLWGWRSFFFVLLFCAVALALCAAILIERGEDHAADRGLDVPSLVLSTVGFGALLLGFSNASSFGLADPFVWAPVLVGAAVLVWFVLRQKRVEHPLIHLGIFASWRYRVGFWAFNLLWASFMGVTLLVPLYIQGLWGGTAMDSGFALLSGACVALVGNPLAGILSDRIGARPVLCVAGILLAFGSVAMAFLDQNSPFWLIVVLQGVRQAGVSCLISPLTTWSMQDLPGPLVSDGSSFTTAVRQACASLGTALMVFLVTFVPAATGLAALGYQLAFGLSGLFAVLTAALVLLKVR